MARIKAQMIHINSLKPTYHTDCLEILLVLKGSITLHKIERTITLNEGDFSFVNRGIVHYIESEGADILSLKVNLSSFTHIFERIEYVEFTNFNEFGALEKKLKNKIDTILVDLVVNEYILLHGSDDNEELHFIEDQLVQLLYSAYQLATHIKEEEDYINAELVSRYYYVVEYIYHHIGDKITIDDITKQLYMNSAYFSQFMKKTGGVGFKEFLLYRKLIYITKLLLDDQYSLDEIALKAGITDTKSFYSLFKKYYHTSPSKWRKSVSNIENCYEYINNNTLLDEFVEKYKIDKHKENTITKNLKYLMSKDVGQCDLWSLTLSINPYEDMGEVIDDEYQVYKYLSSLLKVVEEKNLSLQWVFPYKYLSDSLHARLFLDFMTTSLYNVGYSKVKKWNMVIQIQSLDEWDGAKKLVKEAEKMINGLNIYISLKI